MATMDRKIDMIVKAMLCRTSHLVNKLHHSRYVLFVLSFDHTTETCPLPTFGGALRGHKPLCSSL
jgi:hypothetical protein